jgi:hypothetical protein
MGIGMQRHRLAMSGGMPERYWGLHNPLAPSAKTIAAGKAVYLAAATQKWMLADSNAGTEEPRSAKGVALTGSSLNQPIVVQRDGSLTIGATLTPGVDYYLSDTPGGICPVADIGSGEYSCRIGMATSASVLALDFKYSGVAL